MWVNVLPRQFCLCHCWLVQSCTIVFASSLHADCPLLQGWGQQVVGKRNQFPTHFPVWSLEGGNHWDIGNWNVWYQLAQESYRQKGMHERGKRFQCSKGVRVEFIQSLGCFRQVLHATKTQNNTIFFGDPGGLGLGSPRHTEQDRMGAIQNFSFECFIFWSSDFHRALIFHMRRQKTF